MATILLMVHKWFKAKYPETGMQDSANQVDSVHCQSRHILVIVYFVERGGSEAYRGSLVLSTSCGVDHVVDSAWHMANRRHEARLTWLFVGLVLFFRSTAESASLPQPTSPDYFDILRSNSTDGDVLMSVTRGKNSSVYKVVFAEEQATVTFRLAEIKSFLRFALQGEFIPALVNEAFAVLLAMHHFNNMQERGHPILGDQVTSDAALSSCDIRLTMELFDSQQSATVATQTFSSVMRRPQSLQTPPATVVVGASISSETMPLAVYTGVNFIPQVSASATSTIFDDKEQFPLFGRTTTNTNGEAAVAARFFHSIGSTHVAIIFGTVRTFVHDTWDQPQIMSVYRLMPDGAFSL
jgi:Receptor family ligand binding region